MHPPADSIDAGRGSTNLDEARSLHVPPGWVEASGYARAHRIRFEADARMAIGDVERKYDALMGENHWRPGYQLSPPPKGYWELDAEDGAPNFVVLDGRHRVLAALLFGYRHILVRWNEPLVARADRAGAPPVRAPLVAAPAREAHPRNLEVSRAGSSGR